MSMDRHSRDWPGGPVPPAPYPYAPMGGKFPPHEIGQYGPVVRQEILAQVVDAPGLVSNCTASLWMSVPDARLAAVLTIAFEPTFTAGLGDLVSYSTIHLAATEDLGGDPSPVEDLIGTAAAPAPLVSAGLRGLVYSPTEEVEGMQADLYLHAPVATATNNGAGRWVAKARWQALRPMSEIEWRAAMARMVLLVRPLAQIINIAVPG